MRGEQNKQLDIPFIETLNGRYEGSSVLEGFRKNTELLCNNSESQSDFYQMCVEDNEIISKLANYENISIPLMSLQTLKDIIFEKLKTNKAGDIYMLTLKHL